MNSDNLTSCLLVSPLPAEHLTSPFSCSHQESAHSYDALDNRTSISFTRIFDSEGSSCYLPRISAAPQFPGRLSLFTCCTTGLSQLSLSSQNTDSLSTERQLGLRTANTSLFPWRWIKPITTKSLAGRRPASILYPHKQCSLGGCSDCSDTHLSGCRVNCGGQLSVWALLLQQPGKQL